MVQYFQGTTMSLGLSGLLGNPIVLLIAAILLVLIIIVPVLLIVRSKRRARKLCRVCANTLRPQDHFCPRCGTAFYQAASPVSPPSLPPAGPVTPIPPPAQAVPLLSSQYIPTYPVLSRCSRCGTTTHPGESFCGNCGQVLSSTATRTQWRNQ